MGWFLLYFIGCVIVFGLSNAYWINIHNVYNEPVVWCTSLFSFVMLPLLLILYNMGSYTYCGFSYKLKM